jgi:SagB-type dehydrogenase family enzyme
MAAGDVETLRPSVYRYRPHAHELRRILDGDVRGELAAAALGQAWVAEGAVIIVLAAVYGRTSRRYGERGIRYVHIEVGHAAQNVYLQAVVLGLGTVAVGAFDDGRAQKIFHLSPQERPLCLMPIGRPPDGR